MESRSSIMDTTYPDLLQSQHYRGELIRFVAGEWQPEPSQQEQLVAHLTVCSYCRIALIELLFREQEYEKGLSNHREVPIQELLTHFVAIHHELNARDYEQIAAYAETIVAEKTEVATKRFPRLAKHLKRCQDCNSMLEEMLNFLKENEN